MSAIFGVVRTDGESVERRTIDRMARVLAHRGRERQHLMVAGGVGFGHCLTVVNAEDVHEAQPLRDDTADLILAADARLDNREWIAAQTGIAPDDLPTLPDSALLLAAYRHWGAGFVEHLVGDFALAFWDGSTRTLVLARDHMGQRGLFYHRGEGFIAFASEARALWAVEDVPRRLSEAAIGRQLLYPVDPADGATLYEGIAQLPGATVARFGADGTVERRTYWEPHAAAEHLGRDEAYYVHRYRAVLEEAVACRVRRLTHPPALLFSGGFDSGAIAALAAPIVAEKGQRLIAVSSVLAEDDPRKARDARAAVEAYRGWPSLDLHYYVRGEEGFFTRIEQAFVSAEGVVGSPYVRNTLYGIAAEKGARLVMDGMGGDYTLHVRAPAMLGRLLRRGRLVRYAREATARRRATGRSWRELLLFDTFPALLPLRAVAAFSWARRGFRPVWRTRAIRQEFAERLFAHGAIDSSRLRQPGPVYNRWRERWLHLLRKAAAAPPYQTTIAANAGLAFTRPFHDKRVVELALAIPESLQLKGGLERYLARQALGDRLPRRLLDRPPGNDAEEPDLFRMARDSAPAALARARELDRGERLSAYVDFDRIDAMITDPDESNFADHARLHLATRALGTALFIAWFDPANE